MKLRSGIAQAATEVKSTAEKIGASAQWNTVALVAVTVVASLALFMATTAVLRSAR